MSLRWRSSWMISSCRRVSSTLTRRSGVPTPQSASRSGVLACAEEGCKTFALVDEIRVIPSVIKQREDVSIVLINLTFRGRVHKMLACGIPVLVLTEISNPRSATSAKPSAWVLWVLESWLCTKREHFIVLELINVVQKRPTGMNPYYVHSM